jgi:hypothetical protein
LAFHRRAAIPTKKGHSEFFPDQFGFDFNRIEGDTAEGPYEYLDIAEKGRVHTTRPDRLPRRLRVRLLVWRQQGTRRSQPIAILIELRLDEFRGGPGVTRPCTLTVHRYAEGVLVAAAVLVFVADHAPERRLQDLEFNLKAG